MHTRGVGMDDTHPHSQEWERNWIHFLGMFAYCAVYSQSLSKTKLWRCRTLRFIRLQLNKYRPRKIIMEVWKWYTSNEVNQHSFSVCAAKSHSGSTRWQRLESKANTALVLIKGLLLPLTGFNEELEVKDKQTNSDFASCSRPALVSTSALIKDPRSDGRELPLRTATSPRLFFFARGALALICSGVFFRSFAMFSVFDWPAH